MPSSSDVHDRTAQTPRSRASGCPRTALQPPHRRGLRPLDPSVHPLSPQAASDCAWGAGRHGVPDIAGCRALSGRFNVEPSVQRDSDSVSSGAPSGSRRQHPYRARVTGPCRRHDHADLHARAQSRRTWCEEPDGSAVIARLAVVALPPTPDTHQEYDADVSFGQRPGSAQALPCTPIAACASQATGFFTAIRRTRLPPSTDSDYQRQGGNGARAKGL